MSIPSISGVFSTADSQAAADLVTYWFERSRLQIEQGHANRAGLIATQSIRASASQQVLEHIKQSGDIFLAWSDKPWILDGAAVRVSIVGFDDALKNRTNCLMVLKLHELTRI